MTVFTVTNSARDRGVLRARRPRCPPRLPRAGANRPLIGITCGFAALASGFAIAGAPPWRWPLPAIQLAFPAIGAAILTSAVAAALTIAATGRLGARSRADRHLTGLATTAATTIAASAITCDVVLLALLTVTLATTPQPLEWFPVTIAAIASLTRLVLAARSACRLALARTRLH